MMKKSFTLIELLVSVAIFAVVVAVAIATLTMAVTSKSKIESYNELRNQGGIIMSEIEKMVNNANSSGTNYFGIGVRDSTGALIGTTVGSCRGSAVNGTQIISSYKDSNGYRTDSVIKFDIATQRVLLDRTIYNPAGASVGSVTNQSLTTGNIILNSFSISNFAYATNTSCTSSPFVTVNITLQSNATGYVGQQAQVTLNSTFTPTYPNPTKAGDSS